MNIDELKAVKDENGKIYEIKKLLGVGGQGVVFEAKGGKQAIKLIRRKSPIYREQLRTKLQEVRRLPIEDLPIAKPLQMLSKPRIGYLMELYTGMQPLSKLIFPGKKINPLLFYIQTGGLKRRLEILAKVAGTLLKMHSRSLIYGDPSPNNIFISEDPKFSEIRLIDSDNIQYNTSRNLSTVYTQRYGAPEIVMGKSPANTLTDIYAFAVIVFETLTYIHPLLGDDILDGEPEIEDKAFKGGCPWVEHSSIKTNTTTRGLERENVLSPGLLNLCRNTFEEGLLNPAKRPGMSKWVDNLYSALDNTLTCSSCNGSFYRNKKECPWCSDANDRHYCPDHILCRIGRWEPDSPSKKINFIPNGGKPSGTITLQNRNSVLITKRNTIIDRSKDMHDLVVEVLFDKVNKSLKIKAAEGHKVWTSDSEGANYNTVRNEWVQINPYDILHFGPKSRSHRFAYFKNPKKVK